MIRVMKSFGLVLGLLILGTDAQAAARWFDSISSRTLQKECEEAIVGWRSGRGDIETMRGHENRFKKLIALSNVPLDLRARMQIEMVFLEPHVERSINDQFMVLSDLLQTSSKLTVEEREKFHIPSVLESRGLFEFPENTSNYRYVIMNNPAFLMPIVELLRKDKLIGLIKSWGVYKLRLVVLDRFIDLVL